MQRAFVFSRANFGICLFRLLTSEVIEKCDDKIQLGLIAMQTCEVHFAQLERRDLLRPDQFRKLTNGPEGNVLQICRTFDSRCGAQTKRLFAFADFDPGYQRAEMKRR